VLRRAAREVHAVGVSAVERQRRAAVHTGVRGDEVDRAGLAADVRLDLKCPALEAHRDAAHGPVVALRVLVLEALRGVPRPERLAGREARAGSKRIRVAVYRVTGQADRERRAVRYRVADERAGARKLLCAEPDLPLLGRARVLQAELEAKHALLCRRGRRW